MLVAGSISSIVIDPLRLMSASPPSAEKTFRSRIDAAMLVAPKGQPLRSTSNAMEFTNLDLSALVQEDVAAVECAM